MSAVRFLVADSSPALHTFARKMIVGYGFEANWIHTAASAESALALANDIAPHFVLTDCFSRETTTGLQLVETLRARLPGLRWALMSMELSSALGSRAATLGAMFQLRKPFTAPEMQTAMGKALETWGQEFDEVGRRMPGYRRPRYSGAPYLPSNTPTFKAGDLVEYNGVRQTVKSVIISRGELSVQLSDYPGVVAVHKLFKY